MPLISLTESIVKLQKEAQESASFLGHKLESWNYVNSSLAYAFCEKCHCAVTINTDPAPNEIEIGGEAVALNCERK